MSSSYVEVRETENGVGELGFQLNDCETNGIDIQSHYSSCPPKDHTYNKDPSCDEEFLAQSKKNTESRNNENELPKKIVRAHRNIKHKIIKPRNEENVVKTEQEDLKKTPSKTITSEDPTVSDPSTPKPENKTNTETNDAIIPEVSSPKKSNRKRKTEERVEAVLKKEAAKSPKKKKSQTISQAKKENENPTESSSKKEPEIKEKEPPKKSKSNTAKQEKIEKTPETKTTKKRIEETPKEKPKPVKKNEDTDSQGLPSGWTRKVVERKSGKTAGLCDVYIYSPEGIKFRSRPDVAAYLIRTKSKLRIEDFSFKRTNIPAPVEKRTPKVTVKVSKKEKEKPKTSTAISSKKKGAKLKVKIATPRKSGTKSTPVSKIHSQVSTETKRTGANRKKKNT